MPERENTTQYPKMRRPREAVKTLRFDGTADGLGKIAQHLDGKYAVVLGDRKPLNDENDAAYQNLPGLRFIAIPENPAMLRDKLDLLYPLDGVTLAPGDYLVQARGPIDLENAGGEELTLTPGTWHPWTSAAVVIALEEAR